MINISFEPKKNHKEMAEEILNPSRKRYAVVTGGNKGIGFEICKQLASKGIMVILTARDDKRGTEAQEKLEGHFGHSNNLVFHQLDVLNPASIASLVEFVTTSYGRLDILVNNAGIGGVGIEEDVLILQELIERDLDLVLTGRTDQSESVELKANGSLIQTFEGGEECLQTNYYGAKRITEAFIPLLELSESPRIVNVSSMLGNLRLLCNEWAKQVLSDSETLTEEKVDKVIEVFLKHFKEGSLKDNKWPIHTAAYKVSKAALNAYTRIMAKKYPRFCINSVCPGFCRTDITCNLGPWSAEEGAEYPVKLALIPHGGPSGLFFYRKEVHFFS